MTVLGVLSAPDYDLVVSSVRQVVPSIFETPLNTISLLGSSLGLKVSMKVWHDALKK